MTGCVVQQNLRVLQLLPMSYKSTSCACWGGTGSSYSRRAPSGNLPLPPKTRAMPGLPFSVSPSQGTSGLAPPYGKALGRLAPHALVLLMTTATSGAHGPNDCARSQPLTCPLCMFVCRIAVQASAGYATYKPCRNLLSQGKEPNLPETSCPILCCPEIAQGMHLSAVLLVLPPFFLGSLVYYQVSR